MFDRSPRRRRISVFRHRAIAVKPEPTGRGGCDDENPPEKAKGPAPQAVPAPIDRRQGPSDDRSPRLERRILCLQRDG